MFVYLSKKIAIPNNVRLNCLAWNREHGYVALGGDDGLVKVLKLDQATSAQPPPNNGTTTAAAAGAAIPGAAAGIAAPSNLSMNQSLEGHKAAVQVVCWNEKMQKLTTSDQDGVIIVWMMYKGQWYEEMTNDRKKSTVRGMSWTVDGQKICIVYEDGAIIVGSADGNRIWGKELRQTVLTGVQWSPDGRLLLFSLRTGEVHLYDNQGVFVMKLNVQCVALSAKRNLTVVGLHWHHGGSGHRPVLVICYENGMLQIMKHENDDLPVIVDTGLLAVQCLWNHVGSVLAVCGTKVDAQNKESNNVMFYSVFGTHLRTLKIPGREISAMAWEGNSLRCAMTVDSFIYFANIRPDYMWCYFNKTVVFVNGTAGSGAATTTITFWDTTSNQSFAKAVDTALGMAAAQDLCVVAVELPQSASDVNSSNRYQLLVCNSISTTVDSTFINIRPLHVAMNSQHVVVASRDHFTLWHFSTPKSFTTPASVTHPSQSHSSASSARSARSAQYHIDDTPSAALEILNDLSHRPPASAAAAAAQLPNTTPTSDAICCIALSERLLLVARESGTVMEYAMPQIALRHRHRLEQRAYKMSINSNSTRAAIIDTAGVLTTIDLVDTTAGDALLGGGGGGVLNGSNGSAVGRIERKDVWAMCWARDNPQLLALMEKTRMYVIRGSDPEEPIACSGYICAFEDLEITGVLLDDLVNGAAQPDRQRHVLQLRVKSLRDAEELLAHVGIAEAKQFIEDNPHPRLWRLFAQAALRQLDLDAAEAAFVRCTNYPGIQLVKRLRSMAATAGAETLQRAEVAAFFGDFDEAERLYLDADRKDLAIELRSTLCDWPRTVQLARQGGAGAGMADRQLERVWQHIGAAFAAERSWPAAREYYAKAHDIGGQAEALYQLERFEELAELVERVPERDPLLGKLGQMLSGVGMCDDAVAAYLRLGDAKAAVDTCVALKQWGQAVALAQKYRMPQIAQLLDQHAGQLLVDGRLQEAIALQRKAGRFLDAARLMTKLAEGELAKGGGEGGGGGADAFGGRNHLRIKKIYVMAGLLTEEHLHQQTGATRMAALAALQPDDAVLVERIWTAACAHHFWLLVQRQLRGGLVHSAVLTALRLREYEDVLCEESVHCMLALASCADRSFGACSRAFIKLESLEGVPETRRLQYEELAVAIFAQHEPHDARSAERVHCFTCEALVARWSVSCAQCGSKFPACVASGQPLQVPTEAWQCGMCHHCAHPAEMVGRRTCPLCHSAVVPTRAEDGGV